MFQYGTFWRCESSAQCSWNPAWDFYKLSYKVRSIRSINAMQHKITSSRDKVMSHSTSKNSYSWVIAPTWKSCPSLELSTHALSIIIKYILCELFGLGAIYNFVKAAKDRNWQKSPKVGKSQFALLWISTIFFWQKARNRLCMLWMRHNFIPRGSTTLYQLWKDSFVQLVPSTTSFSPKCTISPHP